MRRGTGRRPDNETPMSIPSFGKIMIPALLAAASVAGAAQAQTASVKLFKVVTVKDEVIIGLRDGDIAGASSLDAVQVASALKAKGELGAWRYAVRKAADGSLQQAPLHKIGLLAHDTLRVEPYASPLTVLPPQ